MKLEAAGPADLRALNTFGVAARARRFMHLRDEAQLPHLAELCARDGLPFVLGGGSNVLLTRDLDEPVLQVALRGIRFIAPGAEVPISLGANAAAGHVADTADDAPSRVVVEAAAGESWHALVRATVAHDLWGLENLALIWGQVGASPIQNIGAYGVEMREAFESLRAMDLRDGSVRTFDAAACRFGYRDSFFKTPAGRRWLVLSVRFALSRTPRPRLEYGELRARLGATPVDSAAVADAVAAIRRSRLPDPAEIGNAGSFFKNPVIDADTAAALRERHPGMPVHPAGAGLAKLSAAWLIEQAGWKGARRGDAGVSARHALVLVNHGAASGAQLLALARDIQDSVAQRFGVRLAPEPVVV